MIIESITLKNFRQYLNDKVIFAKPENDKNFTIIKASKGVEKVIFLMRLIGVFMAKKIIRLKKKRDFH